MTNLTTPVALDHLPSSARCRPCLRRAAALALTLVVLAALTGAWLAMFTFIVDFTPPRPS